MKNFICQRCGVCCKTLVEPTFWENYIDYYPKIPFPDGRPRTDESKRIKLLEERKKYPLNIEGGCEMLVKENNGTYFCLPYRLNGYDKRPSQCREYKCDKLKDI